MNAQTSTIAKKETNEVAGLPQEYFEKNVNVGLTSLSIEDIPLPTLNVIQSNSKFKDADGRPYAPGKFFYKGLDQVFDIVDCSILVIKKQEMRSYEDPNKLERTYQFLGIMDQGKMPFVMYNKSSSYFAARSFIGAVKARRMPMYTLKVAISTEKRQNNMGEWFVPVFTITGVRTNPEEIVELEELAFSYDTVQAIRTEEDEKMQQQKVEASAEIPDSQEEDVNIEEIPF